ncbi:Hypothetical_protein [Hexamita inflata]|uniref:Hypothetical_protein n=1 Tax=Hexamita inflata TaxID=28002 RepID=A0AA86UBE6_9EUKA|nr:Hypothetical protein HINF_LOCUS38760 [Hexamita inflata]
MHVFGLSNMILQTYFSAQNESRCKLLNNFMRLYCSKVRLLLNHNFQHHKAQTISKQFQLWSSQAHLYETQRERNGEENKAIENISLTLHSINNKVTKQKRGKNQRFSQRRNLMENFCCQFRLKSQDQFVLSSMFQAINKRLPVKACLKKQKLICIKYLEEYYQEHLDGNEYIIELET